MRAETLFCCYSVPSTWNAGRNSEQVCKEPKERKKKKKEGKQMNESTVPCRWNRTLNTGVWETLTTSVFLLVTNVQPWAKALPSLDCWLVCQMKWARWVFVKRMEFSNGYENILGKIFRFHHFPFFEVSLQENIWTCLLLDCCGQPASHQGGLWRCCCIVYDGWVITRSSTCKCQRPGCILEACSGGSIVCLLDVSRIQKPLR